MEPFTGGSCLLLRRPQLKANRPFKSKRKLRACGLCKPHKRGFGPARTPKQLSEAKAVAKETWQEAQDFWPLTWWELEAEVAAETHH